MPAEPNEIDPGLALASAIKSCTVFQGRALGTTITLALEPIISAAARSFVVSNDKLGNSAGAIVNARRRLAELAEVFEMLERGVVLKCAVIP